MTLGLHCGRISIFFGQVTLVTQKYSCWAPEYSIHWPTK